MTRRQYISIRKQWALSHPCIRSALAPFGLEPGERQLNAIREYMDLLVIWNQKVSLTSLDDTMDILQRHFGESMFGSIKVPIVHGRLADVGSGAGFPGVALKIVRPLLDVLLIEPNAKKAAFLAEVIRRLNLNGAEVFRGRAEEISPESGQFQFVTARAFGDYEGLLRWSEVVLARPGKVVLWVGADQVAGLVSRPRWRWSDPIPVPVSRKRVILVGQGEEG